MAKEIALTHSYIKLTIDNDGILEFIFDQPGKKVNTMGDDYFAAMTEAIAVSEQLAKSAEITGVYVGSGKPRQFFAGGDIKEMLETPLPASIEQKKKTFDGTLEVKRDLRKLETLGVPVAVGINGACLGGGYEIALACHYRIALPNIKIGLPESGIGLLPGAGGIVRTTYLLGMQKAIDIIATGRQFKAAKALDLGMVDALVDEESQLMPAAKAWLLAHPDACQPWDKKGFTLPGGDHDDPNNMNFLYFGPTNVLAKTKGLMPAQEAIFACISDVAKVDIDTAMKIEARYFVSLLYSQTARNMMLAFFIQMGQVNSGAARPKDIDKRRIACLGILGAGQMGAGIAATAVTMGISVVLKDVGLEAAQRGLAYVEQSLAKNKRLSDEQRQAALKLLKVTDAYSDLSSCELVIEAVFEDRAIKAQVTQATEAELSTKAVFASNTSALPITELALASSAPERFIGMHFFSPVEKMPLVEIICGAKTAQQTLALAFDVAQQLGKIPIVVNDGPGFFTSRIISQTITQGSDMLEEGVNPVLIEAAARDNGSPIGPLAAIDEISQETAYRNGLQHKADKEAQGGVWQDSSSSRVIDTLVNKFGRKGKKSGGGYYEYPAEGGKYLWPGLKDLYAEQGYCDIPYQDIRDRLLFSQSLEAIRAMEDGVIEHVADGNIGSIMGIGFPAQTGGVFQFINAYGVKHFIARAEELAELYGEVFTPPQLLKEYAQQDKMFF